MFCRHNYKFNMDMFAFPLVDFFLKISSVVAILVYIYIKHKHKTY